MQLMISCNGDARPMIASKVIMKVAAANSESNEGRQAIGHRPGIVFTFFTVEKTNAEFDNNIELHTQKDNIMVKATCSHTIFLEKGH